MLVLKNVKSNESIGVMKRIFDLGYDILQNEMNNLQLDCDTAFNLCVLYYNEFYHSEYNLNNMSEYDAIMNFYNHDETFLREWVKRINLMFNICSYYEYVFSFDVETMELCVKKDKIEYRYFTMAEFALGWITNLIKTSKEIGFKKIKIWSDEDLNRLRNMGGLSIPKEELTMEKKNRKYFVLSAEEGDISILSICNNYTEACESLKKEVYAYRDKIIKIGKYSKDDLKINIEDNICVLPYANITLPDDTIVYFMVNHLNI